MRYACAPLGALALQLVEPAEEAESELELEDEEVVEEEEEEEELLEEDELETVELADGVAAVSRFCLSAALATAAAAAAALAPN